MFCHDTVCRPVRGNQTCGMESLGQDGFGIPSAKQTRPTEAKSGHPLESLQGKVQLWASGQHFLQHLMSKRTAIGAGGVPDMNQHIHIGIGEGISGELLGLGHFQLPGGNGSGTLEGEVAIVKQDIEIEIAEPAVVASGTGDSDLLVGPPVGV